MRTGIPPTADSMGSELDVPDVANAGHVRPYVTVGVGYSVPGASGAVYGVHRQRTPEDEQRDGKSTKTSRVAISATDGKAVDLAWTTAALALNAP